MKRLVIHAGMAKTGTTTIQDQLGGSAQSLREHGVYYPDWRPFNHSYELAALFRSNPKNGYYYRQFGAESDEAWEAERDRLRARWAQFFSEISEGTAILSAEGLEQFLPEDLDALLEFVRPFFDECVAIIYVRHPLTSIKSRWEQAIKQLEKPESPDALLAECIRRTRFGAVRRWRAAVGRERLIVRPFDRDQFHGGGLLTDFFYSIGLARIEVEEAADSRSNTSLGHNGTAFLMQYNGQYPKYRDGAYNLERGMSDNQEVLYRLMRAIPDEPLVLDVKFTAAQAEAINREIACVNEHLGEQEQFSPVAASAGETYLPRPENISPSYVGHLANGLLKLLEREKADRQHLGREVKRLLGQVELLESEAADLREQLSELLPPEEDPLNPSENAEDQ